VRLAKGVLYTMTISKLNILGATALACGFASGGVRTFGQIGDLGRSQQPPVAKGTASRLAEGIKSDSAKAVSRLADVMKRHPARLGADRGDGYQVYMLDLVEGGMTLIADEPVRDCVYSGIPRWSYDGNRIVFDTSGDQRRSARLMAIEARDGRPTFTDLGAGNFPTISPDDKWIAFSIYPGAEPEAEAGVWLMHSDGSERRWIGGSGAPSWSPDGRQFLINSNSLPNESTVLNFETKDGGVVEVSGHQIFSWPSWAGPGTLVSALATNGEANSIALLDVRKPAEAKIIEVLWKRGGDLDVAPRWPVYQPDKRRCVFVGEEPTMRTLYSVQPGESLRARRMEVVEHQRPAQQHHIAGLSFSPDGRYLLFSANRPERK
jgi:dipeptidyl aminopeptidase/acylaminoacyl peptidase